MIHFSTLPSGLYPAEEMQDETVYGLSENDELFFHSLQPELDRELKAPPTEIITRILEYSTEYKASQK